MKTLQEIKEEVALSSGYTPLSGQEPTTAWSELLGDVHRDCGIMEHYIDIVATLYAEQTIEASVEFVARESWLDDVDSNTTRVLVRLGDKIDNLKELLK